ncbi:MAG TPA: hypothetical protein VEA37_10180 [Flavobacterium sp.]|nr:hypothetical protein [Flavobacterium sp.]
MKVYIVSGYSNISEEPVFKCFTNKKEAQKYRNDEKNSGSNKIFEIDEKEFPISAKGIVDALEYGAFAVWK